MDTEIEELRKENSKLKAKLKRRNPKGYTEDFLAFWDKHPKRWTERGDWVKIGKWDAWIQWGRMTKKERLLAGERVKFLKAGKYIPDPCRSLKHKFWLDFEDQPKPRKKVVAVQKPEPTPEQQKKAAEQTGKFLASFGKPPARISQAEFDRRKREAIQKLKGK